MNIIIPDEVLHDNQIVESELKQEIAIFLFQTKKLNLVQASNLVQMNKNQFQDLIASHKVSIRKDTEKSENNISNLQQNENSFPRSFGMGASGLGNLSERVDELLWQE